MSAYLGETLTEKLRNSLGESTRPRTESTNGSIQALAYGSGIDQSQERS